MKKTTEYELIREFNLIDFNKAVNKALSEGWKLHEAPCISRGGDENVYAQAVVRYAEDAQ